LIQLLHWDDLGEQSFDTDQNGDADGLGDPHPRGGAFGLAPSDSHRCAARIQILTERAPGTPEKIVASRTPKIRYGHLKTGPLAWPTFGAVAAVQRERRLTRRSVVPEGECTQCHLSGAPGRVARIAARRSSVGISPRGARR
jgi:hypothetical protein